MMVANTATASSDSSSRHLISTPVGLEFVIVGCLLHSGNPKMLRSPSRPAPALSQPGHGPAPTTEETPALLLGRPSGGLWMQRGRLVSEDHCTPMAPRVCRKPGPQQVGVT